MKLLYCEYIVSAGYNSTGAFNDRRLVDIARLVPFGPSSDQTTSQNDSNMPLLDMAVCHPKTPLTSDDGSTVSDVVVPPVDESTLADLKLGVSVPVSIAAGLSLTEPLTEAEPTVMLELPISSDPAQLSAPQLNLPPPGVNHEALNALEMLLGMRSSAFSLVDVNFINSCRPHGCSYRKGNQPAGTHF